MSKQQRHLLHSMGIDVWVVKDVEPSSFVATQFWRDQPSEPYDLLEINNTKNNIDLKTSADQKVEEAKALVLPVSEDSVADQLNQHQQAKAVDLTTDLVQDILPFSLVLLTTPQCSLLVDCTKMSADEKIFLENLKYAIGANETYLHWPPSLAGFKQDCYVNAYINGFIHHLALNNKVILVGNLPPTVELAVLKTVPNIAELINDPMQKRALWTLIKAICEE